MYSSHLADEIAFAHVPYHKNGLQLYNLSTSRVVETMHPHYVRSGRVENFPAETKKDQLNPYRGWA